MVFGVVVQVGVGVGVDLGAVAMLSAKNFQSIVTLSI